MTTDALSEAHRLSDHELVARVRTLAQQERATTAALIAHLAVFDARRLYLGEGCTSLFAYCTEVLRLAEYAAYNRIEAARAAREYPVLLEMLTAGDLTLATIRLLAPHLSRETYSDLLAGARGKSKREVEELVAELRPKPLVPPSIRMQPMQKDGPPAGPGTTGHLDLAQGQTEKILVSRPSGGPRPVVEPLGRRQFRVQFTASEATRDKLRLAQDLLRHQIPEGDLGEIVDRALTLLLEALVREKFAATGRPRARLGSKSVVPKVASRHIPAHARRAVWLRDDGRCAFVGTDGRRCGARGFLEFHHVVPFSAGGESTVDNIELRCSTHNRYEAEVYFGRARISAVPGESVPREMNLRDPGGPGGLGRTGDPGYPGNPVPPGNPGEAGNPGDASGPGSPRDASGPGSPRDSSGLSHPGRPSNPASAGRPEPDRPD